MNRKEQDAIRNKVIELSGYTEVDGSGCDSGDPLDLTLTEIAQGFTYIDNRLFDAIKEAQPDRVWPEEMFAFDMAIQIIKESACQNAKP
jgi:hypothetical protein